MWNNFMILDGSVNLFELTFFARKIWELDTNEYYFPDMDSTPLCAICPILTYKIYKYLLINLFTLILSN